MHLPNQLQTSQPKAESGHGVCICRRCTHSCCLCHAKPRHAVILPDIRCLLAFLVEIPARSACCAVHVCNPCFLASAPGFSHPQPHQNCRLPGDCISVSVKSVRVQLYLQLSRPTGLMALAELPKNWPKPLLLGRPFPIAVKLLPPSVAGAACASNVNGALPDDGAPKLACKHTIQLHIVDTTLINFQSLCYLSPKD